MPDIYQTYTRHMTWCVIYQVSIEICIRCRTSGHIPGRYNKNIHLLQIPDDLIPGTAMYCHVLPRIAAAKVRIHGGGNMYRYVQP